MDTAWGIVSALGVVLALILIPVGAALWEKRLVWPYGPPKQRHGMFDPNGYGETAVASAAVEGFTFLGWMDDMKGPIYKLTYGMLVSPDRGTLAIVGIGRMIGMPLACTWLHSYSGDRQRRWTSCDNAAGVESDVLGRSAVRVVAGGDFAARWASHREWVAREMLGPPLPFPAGAETRELAKLLRERYDLMARSGLVRFLGNDQARWRYTPAGALRVTLGNLWANVAKRRFTRTRTASGRGPGGP